MHPHPWLLAATLFVAGTLSHAADMREAKRIGGKVESLLEFSRERHPEFAAMRLEAAAAAARVESADALPDPTFGIELRDVTNEVRGGSANILPARVGATRYELRQSLPWFGKRDLRRDIAEAGQSEAESKAAATWVELAWQIKQTYAQHYLHAVSLQYARENLEQLAQLEKIAQARYANGLAPQQDAIRAQTERTALKGEIVAMEGEHDQAATRIHVLLGRPAHVHLLPPLNLRTLPPSSVLNFSALETRLLERNPRLAAESARIGAAEKNRELAYRNRYPDFNVGIAALQERDRVAGWDLMFEVNIPLQQESRRAQEHEAERMLYAARSRQEATRNQVLAELDESLTALQAARRIEELLDRSLLPQAELTLQSALAGYETGKVDFPAVLDAQRQIRKTREDLARARANQQIRLADIERAIGEDL